MGKKPAFNKMKLYASVEEGGLGCPRIDWYHRAFSLSQLSKSNMPEVCAPTWVVIEKELIEPFSVQAFLTQTGGDVPNRNPKHFLEKVGDAPPDDPFELLSHHGTSIWYNKLKIIEN